MLLLLGTVCLAVVTWSYVSEATGVAPWKFDLGVTVSSLLALAALTGHRQWGRKLSFALKLHSSVVRSRMTALDRKLYSSSVSSPYGARADEIQRSAT
jgi:hypothetical protein